MKIVRVISAIFVLVGLGALALAVTQMRAQAAFVEEASGAEGEVTRVERRVHSTRKGTGTHYAYRVKFMTPRGDAVEAMAMETSSSPRFAEGEKVKVLFSRADPERFTFDDFAMLWADIVVVYIFAGAFLGAGSSSWWIAGGKPPGRVRMEARLPEVARAWREGRLNRDSEYQALLVAFAFAGFALLGGALAFVLFAPGVVQVIVAAMLAWVFVTAVRAARRSGAASRESRGTGTRR